MLDSLSLLHDFCLQDYIFIICFHSNINFIIFVNIFIFLDQFSNLLNIFYSLNKFMRTCGACRCDTIPIFLKSRYSLQSEVSVVGRVQISTAVAYFPRHVFQIRGSTKFFLISQEFYSL